MYLHQRQIISKILTGIIIKHEEKFILKFNKKINDKKKYKLSYFKELSVEF